MKKYTKIYMDYFGYGIQDFVPCECCGNKAVDIHHIYGRGTGKDNIKNLMALCRKHHEMAHSEIPKSTMQYIHNAFLAGQRKIFLK
jgi:hypothetical protein